jgi:hypothetical protein
VSLSALQARSVVTFPPPHLRTCVVARSDMRACCSPGRCCLLRATAPVGCEATLHLASSTRLHR